MNSSCNEANTRIEITDGRRRQQLSLWATTSETLAVLLL